MATVAWRTPPSPRAARPDLAVMARRWRHARLRPLRAAARRPSAAKAPGFPPAVGRGGPAPPHVQCLAG
eukprot:365285-Chlamydomonas_euryale.AAC.12